MVIFKRIALSVLAVAMLSCACPPAMHAGEGKDNEQVETAKKNQVLLALLILLGQQGANSAPPPPPPPPKEKPNPPPPAQAPAPGPAP